MVEETLVARSISVTHETIRQWGLKFGREFASHITAYDCFFCEADNLLSLSLLCMCEHPFDSPAVFAC
jgi:hypothetical protein